MDETASGTFLGIDLSTVRQAALGKTVLAVLRAGDTGPARLVELRALRTDGELVKALGSTSYRLCGVDTPMGLPPCAACRRADCPGCAYRRWSIALSGREDLFYHYRLCDALVGRTVRFVNPKPPLSNGGRVDITPLTMRWMRLRRQLPGRVEGRVIEAYPSGAALLLAHQLGVVSGAFPYKRERGARAALLDALLNHDEVAIPARLRRVLLAGDDGFDALIAALTAQQTVARRFLSWRALLGLEPAPVEVVELPSSLAMEERERLAAMIARGPWIHLPLLNGRSREGRPPTSRR